MNIFDRWENIICNFASSMVLQFFLLMLFWQDIVHSNAHLTSICPILADGSCMGSGMQIFNIVLY